jgi:hypothetical protein
MSKSDKPSSIPTGRTDEADSIIEDAKSHCHKDALANMPTLPSACAWMRNEIDVLRAKKDRIERELAEANERIKGYEAQAQSFHEEYRRKWDVETKELQERLSDTQHRNGANILRLERAEAELAEYQKSLISMRERAEKAERELAVALSANRDLNGEAMRQCVRADRAETARPSLAAPTIVPVENVKGIAGWLTIVQPSVARKIAADLDAMTAARDYEIAAHERTRQYYAAPLSATGEKDAKDAARREHGK